MKSRSRRRRRGLSTQRFSTFQLVAKDHQLDIPAQIAGGARRVGADGAAAGTRTRKARTDPPTRRRPMVRNALVAATIRVVCPSGQPPRERVRDRAIRPDLGLPPAVFWAARAGDYQARDENERDPRPAEMPARRHRSLVEGSWPVAGSRSGRRLVVRD
jgi:hypothetical protein